MALALAVLLAVAPMCNGWAQGITIHGAPAHSFASPWGALASTAGTPQGGASVNFKSSVDGGRELVIPGVLYKPTGAAKGSIVVVGGSNGWSNNREGHYARSMSSAGFAVLIIDSYGPRGVGSTLADNAAVSVFDQVRDAYAARKMLIGAGYQPDRMAIMGSGRGGSIALMAADSNFVPADADRRFSLALAVMPTCVFLPRTPKPGASVFMGVAEKDSMSGRLGCQEWAKEFTAAGGKVTSKVYPGTMSGFDGEPANTRLIHDPHAENFVNCKVVVEPDGRSTYDAKGFANSEFAALIGQMRKSCIGRGAFGYTNLTQKANVTLELIDFLDSNFPH